MKLNELPQIPGTKQKRRRLARGMGSGVGKTAGRGQKGQKSRSGGFHKVGFEGGQMPLQRRLPKRGFKNRFRVAYDLIKVGDLEKFFEADAKIDMQALKDVGIVGRRVQRIKLLSDGELSKAVTIKVDKASAAAIKKVEAVGGQVVTSDDADASSEG
ncbi:50S ribosomal protein L15 [Magnetococcales bacterium HHB-1]